MSLIKVINDIFPSDIGKVTDYSQQNFMIDDNGDLFWVENILDGGCFIYYCWWD